MHHVHSQKYIRCNCRHFHIALSSSGRLRHNLRAADLIMVKVGARVSVVGLLTFGTLTSLFSKIVYELQGIGLDGELHYFRKPWFMTTLMFVGMSLCLPLAYLEERVAAQSNGNGVADEPLLTDGDTTAGEPPVKRSELREALMLSIPTVFDLMATVLMNIGLLSVTASVYQMMRGAEMVFAAVLAITCLNRTLNRMHFLGILACIGGIVLVGLSSVLSGEGGSQIQVTPTQVAIGMALIVLSQAVQAGQITFEDYFMSEMSVAPMKIVGYEGVVGSILMICVMAPIVRLLPGKEGEGIHEDIVDTVHMITSSPRLAAVLTVQMLGLLAYNYCGMHVTGNLGAVFRTVLETMRTLFVWLLGLALFYAHTGLGERWTQYSPIQAAGFVVLVLGTVVYGRGDERAAKMAVEEYIQAQAAGDVEAAASVLHSIGHATGTQPIAAAAPAAAPMHIVSSGSFRASQSIAHGSYQEAFASSLRSRGFSFEG
eukprot:jgi/Ulvmu1/7165/UM034_0073.1